MWIRRRLPRGRTWFPPSALYEAPPWAADADHFEACFDRPGTPTQPCQLFVRGTGVRLFFAALPSGERSWPPCRHSWGRRPSVAATPCLGCLAQTDSAVPRRHCRGCATAGPSWFGCAIPQVVPRQGAPGEALTGVSSWGPRVSVS